MTTTGKILVGLVLLILVSGSVYYWYVQTHKQATGAVPVASTTSGSMQGMPGMAGAGGSMTDMPGMTANGTSTTPTPGAVQLDTTLGQSDATSTASSSAHVQAQ